MINWRKYVLERDSHKCIECGTNENLAVHHIHELHKIMKQHNIRTLRQAKEVKELWDINNGATLCLNHHMELHKKFYAKYLEN